MKVRLSNEEIEKIKKTIKSFDKNAKITIFGSRTDLSKKKAEILIF